MKQMKKLLSSLLIISLMINVPTFAKIKSITVVGEETKQETTKEEETTIEETTTVKETTAKKNNSTKKTETTAANNQAKAAEIAPPENQINQDLIAANLAQEKALQEQADRIAALQQELKAATTPMSYAGSWTKEGGFWVFYEASTNQKLKNRFLDYDGKAYYFDQLGHMSVGWKLINNKWYYFNKNGDMKKGWLETSANAWYYLDPETGIMQNSDRIIDGELFNFSSDGLWIKNINQVEQKSLAVYVKSLVRYVNTMSKLKKVNPDKEFKDKINKIIDGLPKDVLSRISSQIDNIYICMEQESQNKNYLRSVSYKDEYNQREYEYLPFNSTKTNIFVMGNNEYNLYYGIGEWLAKTIKYKLQALYNTSVWKVIHSNQSGDIDELLSLTGTNGLIFYSADQLTSLSCAIGWFLMDPMVLKEANNTTYKFINQYIDITTGSPLIYE